MRNKRILNFEVDERLYQHLESLRQASEVLSGKKLSRSELIRRMIISQSRFKEVELTIKLLDPVTGQLLEQLAGH